MSAGGAGPGDLWQKDADAPRILSVTELTHAVRGLLETGIGHVWVEGEVCNHRRQASGHQYFNLKDDKCQLGCVLFHRPYLPLRQVQLSDGMLVHARGELTVYEARGQYQLNVNLLQAAGVGLLQAKFEALKKRLHAEGLFDPARKKPLPKFPRAVGIVTSPTGAAIRDMLNIMHRRAPWVRIVINPARVQGEGAAEEIVSAIDEFQRSEELGLPEVDVIVVCRGGGSAEDLWAFNEEIVARAIFRSSIPVVSAVGHEIDFTIADFVADLRAPTPSAAAELVAPDSAELEKRFQQTTLQLQRKVGARLDEWKARLAAATRGIREPRNRIEEFLQRTDLAGETLRREVRVRLAELRQSLLSMHTAIAQHRPDQIVQLKCQQLTQFSRQIYERTRDEIALRKTRLRHAEGLLRVLAPQATLERGFSITTDAAGEVLHSIQQITPGLEIRTRVSDGAFKSHVKKMTPTDDQARSVKSVASIDDIVS